MKGQFTLRCDSAALSWLKTYKETSAMVMRWITRLDSYDMVIEHRLRGKHTNADGMTKRTNEILQAEMEPRKIIDRFPFVSLEQYRGIDKLVTKEGDVAAITVATSEEPKSPDMVEEDIRYQQLLKDCESSPRVTSDAMSIQEGSPQVESATATGSISSANETREMIMERWDEEKRGLNRPEFNPGGDFNSNTGGAILLTNGCTPEERAMLEEVLAVVIRPRYSIKDLAYAQKAYLPYSYLREWVDLDKKDPEFPPQKKEFLRKLKGEPTFTLAVRRWVKAALSTVFLTSEDVLMKELTYAYCSAH